MALSSQATKKQSKKNAPSTGFKALLMALGTLSSRFLGLFREILFNALFDRGLTDAWYAAFRLPNVFRRLFGEGALSVSFIPVFIEARNDNEIRAQNLVHGFYTLFLIFMASLTVFGILFAEPLLTQMMDAKYVEQAEKFALTVKMSQIMFSYVFLVCSYAFLTAVLNALGKFGVAAFAPTLFNVAMIGSTLFPKNWLSWPGEAIAWGVILGGVFQVVVLFRPLVRLGYFPRFSTKVMTQDVGRVLRSMLPGLLGVSVLQINTLLNLNFASRLGAGSLSYLSLADRLMELPLSLISVSLGSALLPALSQFVVQKNEIDLQKTAEKFMRLNLFMCLPAAVGLGLLAHPIIQILFQHGGFRPDETETVAGVIRIYAMMMMITASVRVMVSGYYARRNTWWPALASSFALMAHYFLAPVFMEKWGLSGLNYSSTLSLGINGFLVLGAYQFFVGRLSWFAILKASLGWLPGLGMLAAVCLVFEAARNHYQMNTYQLLVTLPPTILVGALFYLGIAISLKRPEAETIYLSLWPKISRVFVGRR